MKLTVLGCSGSLPGPDSPASGYLVEEDEYRLVLDLGHGALGTLQQHVAPQDVDAIILSHLHSDHCIDLTAYVNALRYGPHRRDGRIPVIGPSGTRVPGTPAWTSPIRCGAGQTISRSGSN